VVDAAAEINSGDRFAFGKNWTQFLALLDEQRIAAAITSLREMTGKDSLTGLRFLDVGSGSGLFSLAAYRLGADVLSFDYDSMSVACTAELRRRFAVEDVPWTVEQGSALDRSYLSGLGKFDIVYSWGVLHHTGDMWGALRNVVDLVKPGGRLCLSIYNDQGRQSRTWARIKRKYNASGAVGRWILLNAVDVYFRARALGPFLWAYRKLFRLPRPGKQIRGRGMDRRHDMIDWVGGYPFEVARPEQIFDFYRERGFTLEQLRTCGGGIGCNEFVFHKNYGP
jgi:SAM-dependent methyltransferase